MSDLHKQLKETLLEHRQLKKISAHLAELNGRLAKESRELNTLAKKLEKDERDVSKLEKGGMRSLFHAVLGDKDKQLEIERQNYLQTALKFNELGSSIELMKFEIDVLEKKRANRDAIERRYAELIRMREKELMRTNPDVGGTLMRMSRKIDHGHILLKDITEAIEAGREALAILRLMEKELRNASNWGKWDMYGGGSPGYLKHRAVDRARDLSYRVKHALLKFKTELKDVHADARLDIRIQIEGFDRFTDIFFDNLISDWVIQQKIKKALENVIYVRRQVESTVAQMKQEGPQISEDIAVLEKRREQTILDTQD